MSSKSMVAARTPITWRQFSELMSGSNRERAAMARAVASSRGSPWEDDATVKCTFEALIPAFDPRPGRSNVNQTLEVELPTVVKDFGSTKASSSKIDKDDQMRFFLRGPNMSGVDGRLVDLPLSRPFLKLLVHPQIGDDARGPNLHKILSLDDFEEVNPVKGSFLKELRALAQRKRLIENDTSIDSNSKRRKIAELKLHIKGSTCRVEDLALNFTVNPPSKVFQYAEMELVDGGSDIDVTIDNVEQYVEKCEEFYLNTGIAYQMRAFRDGFDRVFPLRTLRAYSPEEVQRLLSGEQCPEWSRDDILNYTEPKLGYTRESPGFLRFVDVMEALTAQERKNFLQFATGCSSLPPGGLANLHPRLTIVRKVESGDGSYPSVNTCVHYLKLPEYSSSAILRERLLTAINEKGFHLN